MTSNNSVWVMIAGPYGSGAKSPQDKKNNLEILNKEALAAFNKGYTPVIGVNNALPLIEIEGEGSFDRIMMPLSLALADRCDCCLRVGAASKGADMEVERFEKAGKNVYFSVEDMPNLAECNK